MTENVMIDLTKRAAKFGVKQMSAQKWAGKACKIMEQCDTDAEHSWATCRADAPMPVLTSKKCVAHKYKYKMEIQMEVQIQIQIQPCMEIQISTCK